VVNVCQSFPSKKSLKDSQAPFLLPYGKIAPKRKTPIGDLLKNIIY
jgi:hypothetical protein